MLMGICGCSSSGQGKTPTTVYQFSENGHVGYMDKTGKVVIEPKYFGGTCASWNGLVSVEDTENSELYTINLQGMKDPRFQSGVCVQPSDNDHYAENSGPSSGFLNSAGKLFAYKFVGYSNALSINNDGIFTIKTNGRYGLFSEKEGISLVSQEYQIAGVHSEGLLAVVKGEGSKVMLGFIDKTGKVVIPLTFYEIEMTAACEQGLSPTVFDYGNLPLSYRFSEGFAAVGFISDDGHSNYGYIGKKGITIIKPAFTQARPFSEGYAAAGIGGDVFGKGTKYGFIDKSGHFIVPPQFADAKEVKDGAAPVKVGNKWGLLNIASWKTTGKLVCDTTFDLIEHEGELFRLIMLSGQTTDVQDRWVDAKGNEIRPHK